MDLSLRMVKNFWAVLNMSNELDFPHWSELTTSGVRVSVRQSNGPGQPIGMVVSAASSLWLPLSCETLFNFFQDEKSRSQVNFQKLVFSSSRHQCFILGLRLSEMLLSLSQFKFQFWGYNFVKKHNHRTYKYSISKSCPWTFWKFHVNPKDTGTKRESYNSWSTNITSQCNNYKVDKQIRRQEWHFLPFVSVGCALWWKPSAWDCTCRLWNSSGKLYIHYPGNYIVYFQFWLGSVWVNHPTPEVDLLNKWVQNHRKI